MLVPHASRETVYVIEGGLFACADEASVFTNFFCAYPMKKALILLMLLSGFIFNVPASQAQVLDQWIPSSSRLYPYFMPMMWGSDSALWGLGGAIVVYMVLRWVFIIAIVILVFRLLRRRHNYSGYLGQRQSSALDLLKERYARGEIDKKEFEEKKKDLMM